MVVTMSDNKITDMSCSKDLSRSAENVFVFTASPLFWIPGVQQGVSDTFPMQSVNVGQVD